MSGLYKDLSGVRFNKLVVLRRAGKHGSRACWECQCDCGKVVIVETADLRSGNTKSCGCLRREQVKNRSTKHGCSDTRLYEIWKTIRKRCRDSASSEWEYYGGRGISVCAEWDDFMTFREWAMSNGYDGKSLRGECTIDRIDVDGNYCPENCRWVSMKVQANNKRNNLSYTFRGETKTLKQWSELFGINYNTLKWHYHQEHELDGILAGAFALEVVDNG